MRNSLIIHPVVNLLLIVVKIIVWPGHLGIWLDFDDGRSTLPVRSCRWNSSCILIVSRLSDASGDRVVPFANEASFDLVRRMLRSAVQVNSMFRSLSALLITETLLKLMAAAASMGLSDISKIGYSNPAAIGIPRAL